MFVFLQGLALTESGPSSSPLGLAFYTEFFQVGNRMEQLINFILVELLDTRLPPAAQPVVRHLHNQAGLAVYTVFLGGFTVARSDFPNVGTRV